MTAGPEEAQAGAGADDATAEAGSGADDATTLDDAFTTDVSVRYADVDTYGHVNNATYATYLEEARIDYLDAVLGEAALTASVDTGTDDRGSGDADTGDGESDDGSGDAVGVVVANLEIDFLRSIGPVDAVTVAVGVENLGRSSFTLEYAISSDDGRHATAETTMVAFDRAARESRPLPEEWRSALVAFEGLDDE